MPKAARSKRTNRADPISQGRSSSMNKPRKDPRDSHLYTDDNPATTLPGTGFATAEKAHATLALISNRSLTYQHQVANTMHHRALHHPHLATSPGIRAAAAVFRAWLDDTYPPARAATRSFRPLLRKETVRAWLPALRAAGAGVDVAFAEVYVALGPRRRLANVLVDAGRPQGADWERRRAEALQELVGSGDDGEARGEGELWDADGAPSRWHAQCIAWAWSPVPENKLPTP